MSKLYEILTTKYANTQLNLVERGNKFGIYITKDKNYENSELELHELSLEDLKSLTNKLQEVISFYENLNSIVGSYTGRT